MNKPLFFSVPAVWTGTLASVLLIGIIDLVLGYEFSSFLFYFIPIAATGWYLGILPSFLTAITSAVIWLAADTLSGHPYTNPVAPFWNTTIRLISFLFVGWTMSKISRKLKKSEAEVKILEGLLPICAQCKRIRDENGVWHPIEQYISKRTNAEFTHGYCSECGNKLMIEAGLDYRLPESQYAKDNKKHDLPD